jgi:hypothetical protein
MFPTDRQFILNSALEQLNLIAGIENVQQDDFDSNGINVFMELKPANQRDKRSPIMEFEVSVAKLKTILKKNLKLDFRIIDFPVMKTEHVSIHDRCKGDPARRKIGFDQTRFGIEVFV